MNYHHLFILINILYTIYSFKCGHNIIKKPEIKIINQTNEENNKSRKLSSYHSIQIYIDNEILLSQVNNGEIASTYYNNLIKVLSKATNYFSKLLTVDGSSSIKLPSNLFSTSDNYIVRSEVKNIIEKKINADLILIPKVYDLDESVDAAAYAMALGPTDHRPILGAILLRSSYNFTRTNAQNFLIMLLLHEITHVLGFSNSLFEYFQTNDTLTKTKTINGIQRTLFTGSTVIKHAKRHFGCDNIEGVELENQGGDGSVGSHWEARIMLGDYMISTDYQEIVISEISLALLEDSGWYGVNYYTGGLFRYGKGSGCNFLNTKCVSNGYTNFGREFCVNANEERCSASNIDRGYCYIARYSSSFPSYYQYFNSNLGGFEPADYCPVSMSFSSKYYFYSRCDSNGKNYHNLTRQYGEKYGENSLCILSSLAPSGYTSKKIARCHKITCNYDKSKFNIDIGDVEVECSGKYEEVTVDGYSGSLICPDFDRVCSGSIWCNDPLTCIEKESIYAGGNPFTSYKSNEIKIKLCWKILIAFIFIIF